MPVILVIDDQPHTKMHVLHAIRDLGYKIKTLSNPKLTDRMIEVVAPDLVLINRQPDGFDSIPVFMGIKDRYPNLPVLLYALKSDTAIRSLTQAIAMAFHEIRSLAARNRKPAAPGMGSSPLRA